MARTLLEPGECVELERLSQSDFGRVACWLSNPAINRWLAGQWHDREFDDRHVAIIAAAPATHLYLVRDHAAPVGLVALSEIDTAERSASVWFLLDPSHRSKGLATEAVHEVMRIAFEELELISVRAWVTQGNDASLRLLKRVGFRDVGVLRRASLLDGQHVDRWVLDLVDEDFGPGRE